MVVIAQKRKGLRRMDTTTADRLTELHEEMAQNKKEIQQIENRMKRMAQAQNHTERKIRTRRLIERGAIVESLIPDSDALTNEQIKTILEAALKKNTSHD